MRILLVLAVSAALTGQLFFARTFAVHLHVPHDLRDTIGWKLDQLIRAYAEARGFNGSVLVARDREVLLDKGYGWRDKAHKLPCTGYTRYQIASTTKTFTSTLILRLAAAGKLALTDKLSRWYPQLPFADSVTIEAMLTHTSGIYDFTREPPIKQAEEKTFIDILTVHPLDFPPGTQWRYSNSNYVLLGFIAGRIMGTDYFHAVRTTIFEPLHMEASGFDFIRLKSPDKAIGYQTLDDSIAIPDEITDSSVPAGAGAIFSTVEDLYRWHLGLQDGRVLSQDWQARAYRKFQGNNYGYGWTIDSMAGRLVVSHSGSISGFGSDFERVPQDDICVVVLSNKSGSTSTVQNIARSLLAILYDQPYSIPKKWTFRHLPPEQLQTYAGLYDFPQIGLTFRLWVEDGMLYGQSANRPGARSILRPVGDDHFVTQEDGDVECWIDRKAGTRRTTGAPLSCAPVRLPQRGRTFTGKKIK
ncbi:MAG TPA: serine hydrolase domain-containing protein [Puia sp.]|nr:serine hydrolase domain-containing protein [Puia sp.]